MVLVGLSVGSSVGRSGAQDTIALLRRRLNNAQGGQAEEKKLEEHLESAHRQTRSAQEEVQRVSAAKTELEVQVTELRAQVKRSLLARLPACRQSRKHCAKSM